MDNINSGSPTPAPPIYTNSKAVGALAALGIIAFVGLLGLAPGLMYYLSAVTHHSKSLTGNPATYSPITYFSEAQELAGEDALLYEMEAKFVKSDGTMDLTASYNPPPSADFTFYIPADKPKDAPPTGAGSDKYSREVNIMVERAWTTHGVTKSTANTRTRYTYFNFGIAADFDEPNNFRQLEKAVPTPKCDFADLWKAAITEGANPEAVSTIIYNKDGYDFRVFGDKEDLYLKFDMSCKLTDDNHSAHEPT